MLSCELLHFPKELNVVWAFFLSNSMRFFSTFQHFSGWNFPFQVKIPLINLELYWAYGRSIFSLAWNVIVVEDSFPMGLEDRNAVFIAGNEKWATIWMGLHTWSFMHDRDNTNGDYEIKLIDNSNALDNKLNWLRVRDSVLLISCKHMFRT